jgi:hypothetical protein
MRFTGTLQEGTVPWARISGAPATATSHPTWAQVTGKPSTFAPSNHEHSLADIKAGTFKGNEMKFYTTSTNNDMSIRIGDRDGSYGFNWIYRGTGSGNNNSLELWADDSTSGELAVKAIEVKQDGAVHIDNLISSLPWANVTSKPSTATRWPSWSEVTDKPSTFAPSSHSHGAGDLPSATTSAKGVVQLSTSTSSTSTTLAATASAVKSVYDTTVQALDTHAETQATLNKLGHVNHVVLTTTLNTTWQGSTAPYTKTQTVSGLLATDTPIVDVVMSGNFATDETRIEAWGYVYRITTANNSITLYATEKPTVSLPIQLKVVR